MKGVHTKVAILVSLLVLLAGCAKKLPQETLAQSMAQQPLSDLKTDRMLVWKAYLTVEVSDVADAVSKSATMADQFHGYVEYNSDSGDQSATLRLRVPAAKLKNAADAIESLGDVSSSTMAGEDVTEQYIDVEARLKNKIELRDRLRQLLLKTTDVKEVVAIETELNRVQSDIDAMEGKIRALKGQVDYSTIEVDFRRKKILGPLGYLFKGIWWGIEKLFVIRN